MFKVNNKDTSCPLNSSNFSNKNNRFLQVHIFPVFSRIRTEYGEIPLISPYSVRVRENAENADQNNSEYGHFLHSGLSQAILAKI